MKAAVKSPEIPSPGRMRGRGQGGFALIEVLVALVLLGLLLVPLWTAALATSDHAERLLAQAGQEHAERLGKGPSRPWMWGSGYLTAWWEPGPRLSARAHVPDRGAAGHDDVALVGLWMDGWFAGEWAAESSSGTEAFAVGTTSLWLEGIGTEVILRMRGEETGWGPPFRTIVPDPGELSVLGSEAQVGAGAETGPSPSEGAGPVDAVHLPYSSKVQVDGVDPAGDPVGGAASPVLIPVSPEAEATPPSDGAEGEPDPRAGMRAGVSWAQARVGGEDVRMVTHGVGLQMWRYEPGRAVDAYF